MTDPQTAADQRDAERLQEAWRGWLIEVARIRAEAAAAALSAARDAIQGLTWWDSPGGSVLLAMDVLAVLEKEPDPPWIVRRDDGSVDPIASRAALGGEDHE